MEKYNFLSVDFQYDFASINGKNFNGGNSSQFITDILIPYLENKNIKVSEIMSDYRLPRGKSKNESCVPGTIGFKSLLPESLRIGKPWIKCMHNPLWIRKNIGLENKILGDVYQSPEKFNNWLEKQFDSKNIIIFGQTIECCVFQTAAELYFRGYNVLIIKEATDPMYERINNKEDIINNSNLNLYAKVIEFEKIKKIIGE